MPKLIDTHAVLADSVLERRTGLQGVPGDPQHVQEGTEDHHQRLRGGVLGCSVIIRNEYSETKFQTPRSAVARAPLVTPPRYPKLGTSEK